MPESDPIASYKQRVGELLGGHQYGAAIKLLEEIVNLRDRQFESLVTWGRERLAEARKTEQKMQQASAPLCTTADALIKRFDYTEAVNVLSAVPIQYRSPQLRALLQQATDLRDECDHLEQDIDEAMRNGDAATLPALVKRLCKLKPTHKAAKKLAADLKQHGTAKVIASSQGLNTLVHSDPVIAPKNLVLSICLVVGLFVGVSVMVRQYLATSKPSGPMKSPEVRAHPEPELAAKATKVVEPKPVIVPTPETITSSSTGMKFRLIPAGEFQMGSPLSEVARETVEGPQHTVRLSQPFYFGVHEVTQSEFEKIMNANPSHFSNKGYGRNQVAGQETTQFPVENVSWFDAIDFCNNLSQKEGLPQYYAMKGVQREKGSIKSANVSFIGGAGYRLPTEAEWEYACRAGSTTIFYGGDTLDADIANIDGTLPEGTKGKKLGRTTAVGAYAPNEFGLYDMHGNVFEWCFDGFDDAAYGKQSGASIDPVTDLTGELRTERGGAWNFNYGFARSACRGRSGANAPSPSIGFRVAKNVSERS